MLSLVFLLAAQSDPLEDLIRSSKELRSFTAVFEFTMTSEAGAAQIRLDYLAPARVRVDFIRDEGTMSTWCVDGLMAMSNDMGDKPFMGRVDAAAVFETLAPTQKALDDAFQPTRTHGDLGYAVGMGWYFDSKSQKANFSIEAQSGQDIHSPLGWLETLQAKGVAAREDGELLRFETDERFRIAISKTSGFLEEWSGTSPKGELQLKLLSLETDKAIDETRFVVPAASASAEDVSAEMTKSTRRSAQQSLRRRIYKAIAGGEATTPWEPASLDKISSVLRPFYELTVLETLVPWFEKNREIQDGVAGRLRELRKAGKSAEDVEQARQRELGFRNKQLDELENGFLTRISIPEDAADLLRAGELLEQEKQVLRQVLQAHVREPVLAAFESATNP